MVLVVRRRRITTTATATNLTNSNSNVNNDDNNNNNNGDISTSLGDNEEAYYDCLFSTVSVLLWHSTMCDEIMCK